jgi:hypothetical protein
MPAVRLPACPTAASQALMVNVIWSADRPTDDAANALHRWLRSTRRQDRMPADLFTSYAWTTPAHRDWARLLASHMHLIGYSVEIDATVDYGSSLHGFMRNVIEARHVHLIVDENYVRTADAATDSGVAVENEWVKGVYEDRSPNWVSIVFVNNSSFLFPSRLEKHKPKGFDFNADPSSDNFPGSEQLEDLWRWIEDLPADITNATHLPVMKQRATRLEQIANLRDPPQWTSPGLIGDVHFKYGDYDRGTFKIGRGEYEFAVNVSGAGRDSVYFYRDEIEAMGLAPSGTTAADNLASFLTPGRTVSPRVGQKVILMNKSGVLCTVVLTAVQDEINSHEYVAPYVNFSYTIHNES